MSDNLLYHGDNLGVLRRHVKEAGGRVAGAMIAFRTILGENPAAPGLAYLANMAPRLVEPRRVLKTTGSRYLHCDPTASHSQSFCDFWS